ncbi:hypothetical protein SDRG_05384 [Saprolegnia diclina VS20]|uniref:Palmitoyltransferase n=1 Tax=Saprolegnia diclina (strain VS20) TaxID=1156394 RepID=T0RX47_SAPDV|nr:hypothetical protein SDRG_05384 [Saprolegnia diclina VS20]EQC37158.1 hypothetical protein SDRG_05384 [Saprolegnia diclina VS20]|eukprot:XP_008609320.1 hypothetical protein SDRG_05384 [Saprolegnia diclina VS20]
MADEPTVALTARAESPSSKDRVVRRSGFQAPYSRDQYVSCAGHLISATALYACLVLMVAVPSDATPTIDYAAYETYLVIALGVHLAVTALLLYAWYSCESCDPGDTETDKATPWLGIVLSGPRWEKTKYCAVCRKTIPGMDHHCTWLNTCVGKKNYPQFFTIAICGVVQFLLQCLVTIALLADWIHWQAYYGLSATLSLALQIGLGACAVVSVPCLIMYFTLLVFHLYLAWLGYGTYDYYLKQRDAQRAKRRLQHSATVELTHKTTVAPV